MTETIHSHNHRAEDFRRIRLVFVEHPGEEVVETGNYSRSLRWNLRRKQLANRKHGTELLDINPHNNVVEAGRTGVGIASFKPYHLFPYYLSDAFSDLPETLYKRCSDCSSDSEPVFYKALYKTEGGEYLCRNHARERNLLTVCSTCRLESASSEEFRTVQEGHVLCPDCYEHYVHSCPECGTDTINRICSSCITNFRECDQCFNLYHIENEVPHSHHGAFAFCSEACRYDFEHPPPVIHGYHAADPVNILGFGRPDTLNNERPFHFGLEMEYEFDPRWHKHEILRHLEPHINDFAILMRDGSLSNGVEIITKPTNYKELVSRFREMFRGGLRTSLGLRVAPTTGMHVNISRSAWKSNFALAASNMVVNNYPSFVRNVAGRDGNGYCKTKYKDREEAMEESLVGSPEKYVSLNIKDEVAELRIFRSAARYDKFRDRMLFSKFLIEYGNSCHDRDQLPDRSDLSRFITNSRRYEHLAKYLPSYFTA